jgi:ketosteroid isomerase-like protein
VPQENVELLIKSNEAFRRGDFDAWAANFDPNVLVRTDPIWPERIIFGRQAVLEWGRSIESLLGTDVQIEDIRDLGDRVLARNHWTTRGKESGIEGEIGWSELLTVRDSRFVFVEMYFDHEHALTVVGLEH